MSPTVALLPAKTSFGICARLPGNLGSSDAVIIRQIMTSGRTGLEHTDTDDPLFSQISFWRDDRG